MHLKFFLSVIFLLGFIYLIFPGPSSINDIPPLPDSLKSDEPGDTTQVPNTAAYFSNLRRKEIMDFYQEKLSYINILGFKISPIRLNHPPEESFTYIRDQQPSTYLEQFTYPFRDSVFINGFEPFDEKGKPYRLGATEIFIKGDYYQSKTNIRYYPSSVLYRILIYMLEG